MAAYAAHQIFGWGGQGLDDFFAGPLNGALLWCAVALCAAAAWRTSHSRAAWVLTALALASWATGDTIWSIRFGPTGPGPPTSVSDVFWLAWYPLMITALALLVRDRVPGFELHRWIDGLAVMLLMATPWVALFVQPVVEHSDARGLAAVLAYAYPIGDAVLMGVVLGVFALMGWRPGRMWLLLGVGLAVTAVADAVASVQAVEGAQHRSISGVAWAAAALLVAYAAWLPHPGRLKRRAVTGWAAIALAVTVQVLAAGIQTYAIFVEIPHSERILTVIVLMLATLQIVVSRPRADAVTVGGGPDVPDVPDVPDGPASAADAGGGGNVAGGPVAGPDADDVPHRQDPDEV